MGMPCSPLPAISAVLRPNADAGPVPGFQGEEHDARRLQGSFDDRHMRASVAWVQPSRAGRPCTVPA